MSSQRVQIGPTWRSARIWAPALLAIIPGIVCAVAVANREDTVAGVAGLVTALLALSAAGGIVHVVRARAWLTITPDGFSIEGRDGSTSYADAKVVGVAMRQTEHHRDGEIHALTRKVKLRVITDLGVEWIEIEHRHLVSRDDLVGGLIDRINDDLVRRARLVLAEGGAAAGDGWRLERGALVLLGKRGEELIPVADLAAVAVFDRKLCVWRRDEPEPAFRLPLDAENNRVLHRLLDEEIGSRAPDDRKIAGLGRLLFERRSGRAVRMALFALAGFMLVTGGLVAAVKPEDGRIVAGAMVVASVVAGIFAFRSLRRRLRCYEEGVALGGLGGVAELRYTDVETFTYQAIKQYYNGAYVGTSLTMVFTPTEEARAQGARKIRYSTSVTTSDLELDGLRDHISSVVGARFLRELAAGRSAQWTADLTLHPDGIEGSRSGLLVKKKVRERILFEQLMRFDLHEGRFRVFRAGETKPTITENVAARNFFPGFMAFTALIAGED